MAARINTWQVRIPWSYTELTRAKHIRGDSTCEAPVPAIRVRAAARFVRVDVPWSWRQLRHAA
jgi:hypothetical protein